MVLEVRAFPYNDVTMMRAREQTAGSPRVGLLGD